MNEADRCLVHRTELNEAERRVYIEFAGLALQTIERKGQRVHNPGRHLPKGNEPHRLDSFSLEVSNDSGMKDAA